MTILCNLGIMYSFLGISLVTQNYINPAIDTVKKKGIVSWSFGFDNFVFYSLVRTLWTPHFWPFQIQLRSHLLWWIVSCSECQTLGSRRHVSNQPGTPWLFKDTFTSWPTTTLELTGGFRLETWYCLCSTWSSWVSSCRTKPSSSGRFTSWFWSTLFISL